MHVSHDPAYIISAILRWRPAPLGSALIAILFVIGLGVISYVGVARVHGFHVHANFDSPF
ncbi:hypothetical protein [Oecophyllibacter saccharovorans]|uniref:Uncharacterized protein n=1 Tax=Oecophyllibacter saccharovorans TaxID=2558360 RepID=A0A506ULL8_9PROT|nr:hypothetical protein [Oecophyllibacter saccharovorans]QDH15402.1 hypothetical protein E3E11_05560 [Oecophyllibacter saccharovorans]TPW34234.1 hypothetical protein E3202_06915 [Oecophyllibacter saccharovorans]TPW36421.1 hypothetical protein E3203_01145 [Oecophyllibacter saccharovorans]